MTIVALGAALTAAAQPKLTKDNIDEVLAAMTLEEKAALVVGSGWGSMNAGSMTASSTILVPGAAGTTVPIDRLGIPATVLSDGPAGLRIDPVRQGDPNTYYCTGFPVGTVLACSWNAPMVEELLAAMGNEVLEYGADVLLAPGMNLHRNPLCGRNFEYFSEDPFLSGKISAAYIRGIQSQGVGVSAKHFAFNNQEINRMENDARIPQRALRELYLKNFEIAVREGHPWTVMSSYNKVNGTYTQQNHDLLTTVLRDEWGFDGIVMTDWGTKDGTVAAVQAGNDLMEPGMPIETKRIIDAVNDGSLAIADLDRNVRNILQYIVRTPRFAGYKYSNKPDLEAHAALVRKAAAEGMVLLENKGGALPMAAGNVALFGLNAYKSIAGGTGSGNVNKPYIRHISEGLADAGFTLDPVIENIYKSWRDYQNAEDAGAHFLPGNALGGGLTLGEGVMPEMAIRKAVVQNSVARNDAAVVVIGRNAGEGDDRTLEDDFDLTAEERDLVTNVCNLYHQAGKKVIVVLNVGGVVETASWKSLPDAILLAWTPGQEVGASVADVLTGASNPSGKLSMTFPINYLDIPSSANFPYYKPKPGQKIPAEYIAMAEAMGYKIPEPQPVKDYDRTTYEEGLDVGYRYFNTNGVAVSYPFGYGLSYTAFEYGKPAAKVGKDGSVTFTVTVKNVGQVAGKEAVQAYVAAPAGGLDKPACELKAFAKTRELQPGESETLTMTVSAYELASYNAAAVEWQTAAGAYKVLFGASVEDIRATAAFKVGKALSWPAHEVMMLQK